MPSNDLVLNVRQVAGYDGTNAALATDSMLLQRGLGGPYLSISPALLVSTALSSHGASMFVSGQINAGSIAGGSAQFSNASFGLLGAQKACLTDADFQWAAIQGVPIATQTDIANLGASIVNASVWTFNGRQGDIRLQLNDIVGAGGAPIFNPRFEGSPRAETPAPWSNTTRLATTAFVHRNSVEYISHLLEDHPFVFSFNGRTGDVTLTPEDLTGAGLVTADSPAFTGVPTAPTAAQGTDTNQIATTAFVMNALGGVDLSDFAPINSPSFNGYVSAPTPPPGTSDSQVATTAFVMNAVTSATAGVASFNTRTGAVTLEGADITAAGGALLVSPVFTGTPQAPTASIGTSTAQIATTAFVMNELASAGAGVTSFNTRSGAVTLNAADLTGVGGALLASPAFTGAPTAPTASSGTSNTQLATTAFVMQAVAAATAGVSSFNARTGAVTLTQNDISAAGGALLASPGFSGVPTAPTATAGTATPQIATTAFVTQAIDTMAGVTSFNTRTGAITLTTADITGAGGAPLASPTFTGVPAGPTAAVGTNSTQLATTAFVMSEIASGVAGVTSFNTRTGAVTLSGADITGAGGALLAGPTFTGIPQAPTAATGTNTTQLATTAFVQAAVSAASAGVISFNSRTGAVTLASNDISAAGGALLASPALSGTPTAPTATAGTSTTQLATTAFVAAALTAVGGVTSFNTRTGAVTLSLADITGAGGAPIVAPAFTGNATINGVTGGYALTINGTPAGSTSGLNILQGGASISNDLTMTAGSWIRPSNYGIFGSTTSAAPQAGSVGEYLSQTATSQLSWNTPASPVQITLTPGDWDISGNMYMQAGVGGTLATTVQIGLSTTANGWGLTIGTSTAANSGANTQQAASVGPFRQQVTANTIIYLTVALFGGSGTTLSTACRISARRMR